MELKRLHPRLQDYVKDKGWKELTDIQRVAFDPILNRKSCIIEAPTSGGKTEAVLFPLLTRISQSKTCGFKVLYIAPLKALLNDLALRVIPIAKRCSLEAFKWHGDVSQSDKLQQMNFPSDILLTTPESIEAILLRRANWQTVFSSLETIVIDEAHYFALTERGIHLASLLERIEANIPISPQRIAVTATIGNPEGLLKWLMGNRGGGECIKVLSKTKKERDFKIHHFLDEGAGLQDRLYDLLIQKKSIVFERSRSSSEETATRINERNVNMRFPVRVKTHHSSVSKQLREDAESSIKMSTETSLHAIISTSTLELGIDIGELDQVIQIGGLTSAGSFLQRVGRTGRREGRPQVFRGLCSDPEDLMLLTGSVSLGLKRVSESILLPTKAFHILAHQIICFSLQNMGATADQMWNVLSKAFCFSEITRQQFGSLVAYMLQEEYLRCENDGALLAGPETEKKFLKANWRRLFAIFDSGPMYNVVDGKKVIGTLDAGFAMMQDLPFIFVLGGQEWDAIKIDHEVQQVSVKKNETGLPPKWRTVGNFDVPFELAQEIGRILQSNEPLEFLDLHAHRTLNAQRNSYCELGWQEDKWILQVSEESGIFFLWTFAGDKINRSISIFLSSQIEMVYECDYRRIRISVGSTPYLVNDIYSLITKMKSQSAHDVCSYIEQMIDAKWVSKFSDCLPEVLAKKTIIEKGMDLPGTIRALNRVVIEYDD